MIQFPLCTRNSYSFGERILRTTVFQIGVLKGSLEQLLNKIYKFFSKKSYDFNFDPIRGEATLKNLKELGASIEFITPRDGKAKIQMMTMQSSDLEEKIESLGGTWEKIKTEEGKEMIAIVPSEVSDEEWDHFETTLAQFKWPKRQVTLKNGDLKEVIITCESAEDIRKKEFHKNLFIHTNSASVTFVQLSKRAGFYLGCKQNICFYDPRGTWKSSGVASEAGYYNDIYAVYQKAATGYDPKNIWISSSCGGCTASGFLKARPELHEKGVNFIVESSFSDLRRDMVANKGAIVRSFADFFWSGTKSKDISPEDKFTENGFSIESHWKNLPYSDIGKVIIVSVTNDQLLPPEVASRNVALAKRVNKYVHHIKHSSPRRHSGRFDDTVETSSQVLKSIFQKA